MLDPSSKLVASVPSLDARFGERQAQVQRALEPLVSDAVTDCEKAAAKRALDMARAMVETQDVDEAVKRALDMYAADVDRAVRMKSAK